MTILNGKELSYIIKEQLKQKVSTFPTSPLLGIVLVGNNSASEIYVKNKIRACEIVGIKPELYRLPEDITEDHLLDFVRRLNNSGLHGYIVQLPLPEHIDEQKIMCAIDPRKDVDGLTPMNLGLSLIGKAKFISATARGICEILGHYKISTSGKHVVVIGRSNIVGKPIATLLMQKPYLSLPNLSPGVLGDATVTVCHSKTQNLGNICKSADIIIVAAGFPNLITSDMVKEGVTIIDVGINRTSDGRIVGDVDFEGVKDKCAFLTPVPGGVGPMTVTSLLLNTVQAYENSTK